MKVILWSALVNIKSLQYKYHLLVLFDSVDESAEKLEIFTISEEKNH